MDPSKISAIPTLLNKYRSNLAHPKRMANAAGAQLYTLPQRPAKAPTGVLSAQIEITLRCNLSCPMCESPFIRETVGDMTLDMFKKVVDGMPTLMSINLTGIGESLLNKDVFDMIAYAKKKGIYLWFTTNGTLLVEKVNRRLIELEVDELVISFDAAEPEIFKRIRLGATFEQVTENLRQFVKLRKEMGKTKPRLSFGNTLVRDNLQDAPKIVQIAADIGIDKVIVGANLLLLDAPESVINPDTPKPTEEQIRATMAEAQKIGKERGVEVIVADYMGMGSTPEMCDCIKPWTTCYILKDGSVFPCCEVTQRRMARKDMVKLALGNCVERPFYEIWNEKQYQNLRDGITRDLNKRYEFCRTCMRCRRK
ncbi:MAG: radical SAM protein [Candidatus Micrarchaeia archaeon]|jgi:MoaA/NifB/PqqE/SkfB family radical SAM enzyme